MVDKKIREEKYGLKDLLEIIFDGDVRTDWCVQRSTEQLKPAMMNDLIFTAIDGDHIPEIILGEQTSDEDWFDAPYMVDEKQLWVIDGCQRLSVLTSFRFGNYRLTKNMSEYTITYREKQKDDDGRLIKDFNGQYMSVEKTFDLRGKSFDDLPPELQKSFDSNQMCLVTHLNCSSSRISNLIRRYNNHVAMNPSQILLTHVSKFGRKIRELMECSFFKESGLFTQNEKKRGIYERIICESVMEIFHLEQWKKDGRKMGDFINDNTTIEEFNVLGEIMDRMWKVCGSKYQQWFTPKNMAVWFAAFHRFSNMERDDADFADFMDAFTDRLHSKKIDDKSFDDIEQVRSTKDKKTIAAKIDLLESLMAEYFDAGKVGFSVPTTDPLKFLKQNVNAGITEEDFSFYKELLNDYIMEIDSKSWVLKEENRNSLLGIVAYAVSIDEDIEKDWIPEFFNKHYFYIKNQRENFLYMKRDLHRFLRERKRERDVK